EDGVSLALQLSKERGNAGIPRLVDAAGRDQLVDQVASGHASGGGERGRRDVVEIELIGNVQPDVAGVGVINLENLDVEQDLGLRRAELAHEASRSFESDDRSTDGDDAGGGIEADELEFKERPEGVHYFV